MSRPRPVTEGRARPVNLAVLLREAFVALNDLALARLAERGHAQVRAAHGAVFQYLDDTGTTVSTLAERAQMTKQAMAELVRHLEEHGYLVRVPDPDDRRAKLVLPTEQGREVIAIAQELVPELEDRLAGVLGPERATALRADLETVRRWATEGGDPSPAVPARPRSTRGQVAIPGGRFAMGDHFGEGYAADGEHPVHEVTLSPFHLDATTVTNAAFATFVKDTGYVTDAERWGSSAVFHLAFTGDRSDVLTSVEDAGWWLGVRDACWRRPEGPGSSVGDRANHPVVHVSWNDAQAYAAWAGRRLPTEAEWEYAARGGLEGARFPWGDELRRGGRWPLNIWQGRFPTHNTVEDGFLTTAPVKTYRPNGHGLWQMVGNVWEWCADRFSPDTYRRSPPTDPVGPAEGERRVMRGGSYLCHDSYCYRYRVAARSSNTPESSSGNLGFRCANSAA